MIFECTIYKKTFNEKPNKLQLIDIQSNLRYKKMYLYGIKELSRDLVQRKWVFCPATFIGSRSLNNFIQTQIIGLDFDDNTPLDEILDRAKALHIAPGLIYTTLSDKPEHRKYRVLFFFNKPITNLDIVSRLTKYLVDNMKSDPACVDGGSRMFFPGKEEVYYDDIVNNIDSIIPILPIRKQIVRDYSLNSLKDSDSEIILEDYYNNTFILKHGEIKYGGITKSTVIIASFANSRGIPEELVSKFINNLNIEGHSDYDHIEEVVRDIYVRYEHLNNTITSTRINKLIKL